MLNHWTGMGRIVATPELKSTQSGTSVTSFTVAIDRGYKGQDGNKQTDFISVVAWRQTAEFVCRYFQKGSMICVEGEINTRSYTAQDGNKRTVTEVVAERVHFTGEKANAPQNGSQPVYGAPMATPQGGVAEPNNWQDVSDSDELPF